MAVSSTEQVLKQKFYGIFPHPRPLSQRVFVELPKFDQTETELTTLTEKWIYFLKPAGSLGMVPTPLACEPPIAQAFQLANEASLTPTELEIQDQKLRWINRQRELIATRQELIATRQALQEQIEQAR